MFAHTTTNIKLNTSTDAKFVPFSLFYFTLVRLNVHIICRHSFYMQLMCI